MPKNFRWFICRTYWFSKITITTTSNSDQTIWTSFSPAISQIEWDIRIHGSCSIVILDWKCRKCPIDKTIEIVSGTFSKYIGQFRNEFRCPCNNCCLKEAIIRSDSSRRKELTLVNTAKYEIMERIFVHTPIFAALYSTGRRNLLRSFQASNRSSTRLFTNANNGAKLNRQSTGKYSIVTYGNAVTNRVTKPNWIARRDRKEICKSTCFVFLTHFQILRYKHFPIEFIQSMINHPLFDIFFLGISSTSPTADVWYTIFN